MFRRRAGLIAYVLLALVSLAGCARVADDLPVAADTVSGLLWPAGLYCQAIPDVDGDRIPDMFEWPLLLSGADIAAGVTPRSLGFVTEPQSNFHESDVVVTVGDFTGDGVNDLALGWGNRFSERQPGEDLFRVFIYEGPFSDDVRIAEPAAVIRSAVPGDQAEPGQQGTSYLGAVRLLPPADLNDDGVDDLLIAAVTGAEGVRPEAGGVGIFYGPLAGEIEFQNADALVLGEERGETLVDSPPGLSGSLTGLKGGAVGDVSGDGVPDLLLSAPGRWLGTAPENGWVYLMLGPFDGTMSVADAALTLVGGRGFFGANLETADPRR